MVRNLFLAILTAIIFTVQGQDDQCEQSEHVEDIPDLESCNGVGTFISVIYRPPSGASNCGSIDDDYHIFIYHHDFDRSITIEKHPPPERYNETACLVHLTLSPDIFVIENNDTLLQVWMKLVSMSADTYCSNNFTLLVDTDPPDPVNPHIRVGCNSVDVEWTTPFSPPGCPVHRYDIELNDEYFNITNTSLLHHSWSDISPDMLNTLTISAVNDIGPSTQSNNTFITALNPQVMFMDYDVLLNHSNALLTIKAKVNNSCTYSVPTHFYYNASCDPNTTVNETWDVSNFYQLPVPIDCLNCTACLIWSNLNSSLTLCNITFNTTQLLFIKLQPINNGLNFTCHYRPNSSLWGCGISVNNSFNNTESVLPVNKAIGTITNLCPGEYNVAMFYVKDRMDHVIEYVTVNISGTSCSTGTPTPSGTDHGNDKNKLLKILLPSLAGAAILIVIIIIAVVVVLYIKCRPKTGNYQMNRGNKKEDRSQTNGEFETHANPDCQLPPLSDPNCQPSFQNATERKPDDKAKDQKHSDPPQQGGKLEAPVDLKDLVSPHPAKGNGKTTLDSETSFMNNDSLADEKEKKITQELSSSVEVKKASMNEGRSDISAGGTVNDIEHKSDGSNEAQGEGSTSSSMGGPNYVDSSQKGRVLSKNIGGDNVTDEAVDIYVTEEYQATNEQGTADMDRFVPSKSANKKSMKRSKSSESIKSTSSASRVLRRLSSKTNTGTDQERETLLPPITDNSDAVQQDLEVPASNNDTRSQFV